MEKPLKLRGLTSEETSKLLPEDLIFLGYRGSIAHGMYVPSSDPNSIDDKDVMGVFMGPLEHYLGFERRDTWERSEGEWDVVCYENRKLISLLLKNNPNVLSLLWLEDKHVIFEHRTAELLRENREIFVSRKAYHSFTGYAYSQLKRMTHFKFGGYMGEKRKALVEKHGYDTKNAAHLIRLLRMGIEFLCEGRLIVERPDAAQLLQIKSGEFKLEEVKKLAERLFESAEQAYLNCKLPNEPDRKKAETLCMEMVMLWHNLRR